MTGPDPSPLEWDADGAPRSRRFDDIYFSRQDGLAESRAVFLRGCGLPAAWRGRDHFTVGELGFGTGLNVAALLELWRRERDPGARLHIFSVEAWPVAAPEARRALAAWPELDEAAAALLAARQPGARGFHRLDLPAFDATLDLAVMEAGEALSSWRGAADAWFLDGFAPSVNPEMWRDEVLGLVAARSAPGARAATFTVAGAVRRGLEAQGFAVSRQPGHGRKRERLEARCAGSPAEAPAGPPTVAIVGAGIAGAALARAFAALGARATLIEAAGTGAGASGNPAVLVMPRFDAGGGPVARLHAQAFARAAALYRRETPEAVIAQGALQLEGAERDRRRFDLVAAGDLLAPGAVERLSAETASEQLGEPSDVGGLWLADALVVEPERVIARWIEGARRLSAKVDDLVGGGEGWRLLDPAGEEIMTADLVVLAAGLGNAALAGLQLRSVRGQVSVAEPWSRPAPAAWGGYVIPTRTGVLFGATHDRDDTGVEVRSGDHGRNLALLAQRRPALAAALASAALAGRASVRAAGPNHLPLAGELAGRPGVFVLAGLGGRGFTLAPLLAEDIAARALGAPSPLPTPLAAQIEPGHSASAPKGAGSPAG